MYSYQKNTPKEKAHTQTRIEWKNNKKKRYVVPANYFHRTLPITLTFKPYFPHLIPFPMWEKIEFWGYITSAFCIVFLRGNIKIFNNQYDMGIDH